MSKTFTCLALLGLLGAQSAAQTVVSGFDDVSAPVAFKQIFPGLDNGPIVITEGGRFAGGVILDDLLFDQAATSGGNILATCDTCWLGDQAQTMLPGTISAFFAGLQDRVELDVINGVGFGNGTFVLTARDAGGAVIAVDQVVVGPAGGPNSVKHLAVSAPGIQSMVVSTQLPAGYTFAIDTVEQTVFDSVFVNLGHSLAGTLGAPTLSGFGSLVAGEPLALSLDGALSGAAAVLILGFGQVDAPFKQGVLVPSPDVIFPAQTVSGAGGLAPVFATPAGIPAATTLVLQYWIADAGAPAGYAASNGLSMTTP